jgi:hypothetical protein
MGEKRNAYRLLAGKPKGRRPLGRPRSRWVDNIMMDLGGVRWDGVDWIGLTEDRNKWRALVNSVMNFRVPQNAGKLSSGLTSSAELHRVSELHGVIIREEFRRRSRLWFILSYLRLFLD